MSYGIRPLLGTRLRVSLKAPVWDSSGGILPPASCGIRKNGGAAIRADRPYGRGSLLPPASAIGAAARAHEITLRAPCVERGERLHGGARGADDAPAARRHRRSSSTT